MSDQLGFTLEYALSFIGVNYEWGGNNAQGFDCSGYVCEILRPSGLIGNKEDLTAAAIHNKFKSKVVGSPSLGCLVFYGRDIRRITHVAFMITEDIILEAGGGGSSTIDAESADKANAFVRARPYNYRTPVSFINLFDSED